MFHACKPTQACRKVIRSGHSVSFDDEEVTKYTEAHDIGPGDLRRERQGNSAGGSGKAAGQPPKGVFAACGRPQLGGDLEVAEERRSVALATAAHGGPSLPDDPGYALLEAGDDSEEEFTVKSRNFVKQFSEVNKTINSLQMAVGALLLVAGLLAVSLALVAYGELAPVHQQEARRCFLLASIPVVACLFTWFHIWLAIQMMFRPLDFIGLWQHRSTGMGIGWQGVVPRKAAKMASIGYKCARPYLMGPRDIMGSVNPQSLVSKTRPQLARVIEGALVKVGAEHFPWIDGQMGLESKRRIATAAVERIIETCPKLWQKFTDLLSDKRSGIDNDGMMVKVFSENKELLNRFFLSLGEREFRFIEHCGAVMGFICGLVQLVAFSNLSGTSRVIFLPVTGFFLGMFSNWLAIQMVFKPCYPKPVILCGWHIYDIQGLFLKRQQDVAVLYSKMVVDHFLAFDKVVEYLMTQEVLWGQLKAAYLEHNTRVMKETLGVVATWVAPLALGQQQYTSLEESMKMALVEGLYDAKDVHKIAGRYVGKVTEMERKNCQALQKMPPDEFENLLHPVFQEDEWILVLLGGILGVIVGVAQVYFLS